MTNTSPPGPPPLPDIGSVITAKPWKSGRRLERAMRGLVVRQFNVGTANVFICAWFPAMGAPAAGGTDTPTVHGVMPHEIESTHALTSMPETWIVTAERVARRTRIDGGYDIGPAAGFPLEIAAKAHRRARAQSRRTRGGEQAAESRH